MDNNRITHIKTHYYTNNGIKFKSFEIWCLGGLFTVSNKKDVLAIESILNHFSNKLESYDFLEFLFKNDELLNYKTYL